MNCQTSAHIGQREPSLSIEHYENFPVASWLCPPALRPAVIALYHFARTADDLADEGDAARAVRVQALRDYRADLNALAAGRAPSARWTAVFAPLARELHRLDATLLHDLLDAFEQDLAPPRYRDRDHLLDYCRRSANPIGRLLLGLYGVDDTASLRRSDAICSALQLINFWQDFSRDGPRGRLYVPQADLDRHGVSAEAVLACQDGPAARALIRDLCGRAAKAPAVRPPASACVQGGLLILDKIAARGHDSPVHRPKIEALDLPRLAWRALTMRATS